jgi:signal transduction histidine kinase
VFTERTERIVVGVAAQAAVAVDNARLYEDVRRAADERKLLLDAERAARAQAERVSLQKDEFLATLSHELRTPLNAILGWSQLLRARAPSDDADLREGLVVIERNAKVQTQLIEDLLDMSRIISGKVRLDVQRVDLRDVVQAAVASVRHSAEAKDIRLHVVLDPQAGPVRGDPNRLQQCFWNC